MQLKQFTVNGSIFSLGSKEYGTITIIWNDYNIKKMRSSLQSDVMYLNLNQIDKTNKILLDLRARCVVGQNKLKEAKRETKTHSVKGQVRSARGRYICLALKKKIK